MTASIVPGGALPLVLFVSLGLLACFIGCAEEETLGGSVEDECPYCACNHLYVSKPHQNPRILLSGSLDFPALQAQVGAAMEWGAPGRLLRLTSPASPRPRSPLPLYALYSTYRV
ncbi:MAG: hypothetical protein HYU36_25815 [Planctomycetes bacterium]|nr:hypothetical protein [Planctomycetota bacterium]